MHVQLLSITTLAIDNRCHDDKLIFGNEIPDTSLVFLRLVSVMRNDIEFQGGDERYREQQQHIAA